MERTGMYTLAAHGDDLIGSAGAKANSRAELRLDLKLTKDDWRALSVQEQEDYVAHLIMNSSQPRRLADPQIISWNTGPLAYSISRDEI